MPDREAYLRNIFGEHFRTTPVEELERRLSCQNLLFRLNSSAPEEIELRQECLAMLLGAWDDTVHIEPPFRCDVGKNTFIGSGTFINYGCTILDTAKVQIGQRCWIAPNVQIYAATHPVNAEERRKRCIAKPITIGNDVWLGGSVIICPGVTIGDRAVIGAGSVVTKDIPSDVVAFGNPCKVHRTIEQ